MPELPEVETVRRGLIPALEGARIRQAAILRADLRFAFPAGLAQAVTGKRINEVDRRAKYLLLHLEGGLSLISHLGMSGSYRVESEVGVQTPGLFLHDRSSLRAHDHVVLDVEGGAIGPARVIYNDPRRFGFLLAAPTADLHAHPMLADLGPEPTGNALSAAYLAQKLAGKRAPLKAVLLDQRIIAGLGNIYVCEALSRAHLSPRRIAATLVTRAGLPTARLERLTQVIGAVIGEAIAAGGSSLRDHRQTDGSLGYFQHRFGVYDREHAPCPTPSCRGTVKRIVQSGRSTFYCSHCQR